MYTNYKLQNTLLLHRNEFSTDCTPSFHSLHYFQQEITSYKFLAKIETHSSIGCHYKLTSHYFSFSHYQSAYPRCVTGARDTKTLGTSETDETFTNYFMSYYIITIICLTGYGYRWFPR